MRARAESPRREICKRRDMQEAAFRVPFSKAEDGLLVGRVRVFCTVQGKR